MNSEPCPKTAASADLQAADYIRGVLDYLESDEYERHFFVCAECAARVRLADRATEVAKNFALIIDAELERLISLVTMLLRLPRQNGALQRLPRLTRHQTDPLNRIFAEHMQHTLQRRLRLPKHILAR